MAFPKFISGLKNAIINKTVKKGQILIGTNNDGTACLYADVTDKTDGLVKRFEIVGNSAQDLSEILSRLSSVESSVDTLEQATLLDLGNTGSGGGDDSGGGSGDISGLTARVATLEGAMNILTNAMLFDLSDDSEESGGNDNPVEQNILDDVENASITTQGTSNIISWMDPSDKTENGELVGEWAGTLLLRKEGSAPTGYEDGVIVVNSTEQDQYLDDGYVDSGLNSGVTYYYRFFPYTTNGVYTSGSVLSATIE